MVHGLRVLFMHWLHSVELARALTSSSLITQHSVAPDGAYDSVQANINTWVIRLPGFLEILYTHPLNVALSNTSEYDLQRLFDTKALVPNNSL